MILVEIVHYSYALGMYLLAICYSLWDNKAYICRITALDYFVSLLFYM